MTWGSCGTAPATAFAPKGAAQATVFANTDSAPNTVWSECVIRMPSLYLRVTNRGMGLAGVTTAVAVQGVTVHNVTTYGSLGVAGRTAEPDMYWGEMHLIWV